ncbi:putative E3 ubiquitin-protein ligase UBR7 [Scaptodrosophila lebanonensis]|uniref:E3 ubiquitin-protein ligase UBR7 n=1 Tax=Drosophila lebanonensis TaxID=7225 RepID=A0A6J2U704_DROLE|nr:putative E3 ubiquitin-protein ligase UBR7 [Scaptodrosophila lebanonensis]
MSDIDTIANAGEANPLEESTITMVDVLEQEKEMEEEYAAVLGASDEKVCTYSKGPIQRQALYSCLTCCPEAREDASKGAGVCLACSYRCHENHDLIELYTKRNFRCDCPTLRMGSEKRCALNPQLEAQQPPNAGNIYNQNFQGLYCKCKRPYPDPERTTEDVMLQCAICEDWFHLPHVDAPEAAEKWLDVCSEMICDTCMEQYEFLRDYTGLALQQLDGHNESKASDVTLDDSKLKCDLDRSISDILNVGEAAENATDAADKEKPSTTTAAEQSEEPAMKRQRLATDDCCRPKPHKEHKGATFWTNDWRKKLCKCVACMALYKAQSVEFLTDVEDSAKSYEERGMKRAKDNSSYEQGIRALATIGRTQQIDAITEYNRMKDKLKEYLQSFAASKKVVTEDDINRFFAGMRNENNSNLGQPYFCR